MVRKNIFGALFAVLILSLAMPDTAVADGEKKGSSKESKEKKDSKSSSKGKSKSNVKSTKTELEAELNPPSGALRSRDDDDDDDDDEDDDDNEFTFSGKAKYKKVALNGILQSNRLEAKIKSPFPSPELGVSDIATALGLNLQLLLSTPTGTVPYAACTLELAEIEIEFLHGVVQDSDMDYKLDVRSESKYGVLQQTNVRGGCMLNPATTPVAGVPSPLAGDIATVVLATTTSSTPLLVGIFKIDDDD